MASQDVLSGINAHSHIVQPYQADEHDVLAANVSRYLWDGLQAGEGLLIIATGEHEASFLDDLARRPGRR